jgi:hypothetical protein
MNLHCRGSLMVDGAATVCPANGRDETPCDPFEAAYDSEADAYWAKQEARGRLAGAPEEILCYRCAGPEGVMRAVVALGPIADARRDPTQTYVLVCGHTML